MGRTVAIGEQNFEEIRKNNYFYVDKTSFIKDWWENGSTVTVITRPRRFGKTLTLNMLDNFFSLEHQDKGRLFEGLAVWNDQTYRQLQGNWPVISLTFANVKEKSYEKSVRKICRIIKNLYLKYDFLIDSGHLRATEKEQVEKYCQEVTEDESAEAIGQLSAYLYKHYGKKVLIFLDEYDTPMQEAYAWGFWDEIADYMRSMFNAVFKTNPYMQRAIMTGITRVGKESMFSDFNNPLIASMSSGLYSDSFGFTEPEVSAAIEEMGYTPEDMRRVKEWYDGFIIGGLRGIYNPWSVSNFLASGKIELYWSNTSTNSFVSKLIQTGDKNLKQQFEQLICGNEITARINEQIAYHQIETDPDAVWSLLYATGYLKVLKMESTLEAEEDGKKAVLTVTNLETQAMFRGLVKQWFSGTNGYYNDFTKALLCGNLEEMEAYFVNVTQSVFSSFDSGTDVSEHAPERFYHGFVLGLIVDLRDRYRVRSNRESGLGRYDVMLLPRNVKNHDGIVIEFKVFNSKKEKDLEETARAALMQIEQKNYVQELLEWGVPRTRIRMYGFAFRGKEVIIRTKNEKGLEA